MRKSDTGEIDIQMEILAVMKDGRVWTNDELKRALREKLPWTDDDRNTGKRGEPFWLQRVNNALAQSRPSSLYAKGFVEDAGHGQHRITSRGIRLASGEDPTLDELLADV